MKLNRSKWHSALLLCDNKMAPDIIHCGIAFRYYLNTYCNEFNADSRIRCAKHEMK
jgi:hypothetical protein